MKKVLIGIAIALVVLVALGFTFQQSIFVYLMGTQIAPEEDFEQMIAPSPPDYGDDQYWAGLPNKIGAEALHAKLHPESQIVLNQHNPPFWFPAKTINTPLLWVAGDADMAVNEPSQRKSALHYQADYVTVSGAAHSLMMEKSQKETVRTIHEWLEKTVS